MSRLVAFGCSLTYGHGLSDCHVAPNRPGVVHSKQAWPSIIAKYLEIPCANYASPGSSNKRIWHTISNFKFEHEDIVFIHWTYPNRTSIIKKKSIVDIGPWLDHEYYSTMYDEHDSSLMSKLFISHANMMIESIPKSIKVYNILRSKDDIKTLTLNSTVEHIPVYFDSFKHKYPTALDNGHPGIECHEVFAKKVLDYLGVKNNIPHHRPFTFTEQILRKFK